MKQQLEPFVTTVKITGDFSFNPHNIKSIDGFSFTLKLEFEKISKEQHLFIRQKISEKTGLRPHDIPQPWGDNPVRYEELNFETYPQDYARCKSIIGTLKKGKIPLTANGYRYPPETDHPLMTSIEQCEDFQRRFPSFQKLHDFILNTLEESRLAGQNQFNAQEKIDQVPCRGNTPKV